MPSSCRLLSCRPSPLSCRLRTACRRRCAACSHADPCRPLPPLAVVVPPVTVIMPRCRVTRHLCPAESCRPSPFCRLPSSRHPSLSSCRTAVSPVAVIVPRLPAARCRRRAACSCCKLPIAIVVPTVAVLHLAVVVPPVAVVVPRRFAACRLQRRLQRRLRCPAVGCHGLCQYVCDGWRFVGHSTYFTYSQVGYLARRVFPEKTNYLDHDDTP